MSLHRLSESIPASPEFVENLVTYTYSITETERSLFQDGTYDTTLALATRCDNARAKKAQWPQLYAEAVNSLKGYFGVIQGAITARPELASLAWGGLMFVIEMTSENTLYFNKIGSVLKLLAEDLAFYGANADLIYRNWDLVFEALGDVYGDVLMLCTTVYRTFNQKGGKRRTRLATTRTALNPFSTRFLLVYGDLHLRRQTIEPQLKVEDPVVLSSRRSRRGTYTSSHGSYTQSAHSPSEVGRYERTYSMSSSTPPRHPDVQPSPIQRSSTHRSPAKLEGESGPIVLAQPPRRRQGSSSTSQASAPVDADLTPTNSRPQALVERRGRSPTTRENF